MKISKRKIFHKTDLLSRLYSCFFFSFLTYFELTNTNTLSKEQ